MADGLPSGRQACMHGVRRKPVAMNEGGHGDLSGGAQTPDSVSVDCAPRASHYALRLVWRCGEREVVFCNFCRPRLSVELLFISSVHSKGARSHTYALASDSADCIKGEPWSRSRSGLGAETLPLAAHLPRPDWPHAPQRSPTQPRVRSCAASASAGGAAAARQAARAGAQQTARSSRAPGRSDSRSTRGSA